MPATLTPPPRFATATSLPVVFDTRVVTGTGGGPDKTILNSPRFFEPLGYQMLCGYLHPPGDPGYAEIERKAAANSAPLVSIPDRGPFDTKVFRDLLDVCKREKVAIWHGHDYKTNAIGLVLRRFHPMRLVSTVHGWVHHTSRTPLYYAIDQHCLKKYERVFCVSADLHDTCRQFGVPEDRCILLENGIDTTEYSRRQLTAEAKAALGFPADEPLVGAVGRLEPEKAFDILLRAVKQLDSPPRVVIVGDGSERVRLQALAAELGLADRVHLVGWQSDVRTYFEAMDVFALSSLREGLPNVLLEAMALGVPCAATRIAGIPTLIDDGRSGRLVDPNDTSGLTRALQELLTSEVTRREYSAAGRQTIESRFSFTARIEKMKRVYDEMLGT